MTGHLPKILSKRSRHGTPTFGIILGVIVIVIMDCLSDFDQLIEMLNFNYAIALLMEYAAFLQLRIRQPDIPRPYRIPLGTFGCFVLFLPTILLTLAVLACANSKTYIFSICVLSTGLFLSFWNKGSGHHHHHHHQYHNPTTAAEDQYSSNEEGDEESRIVIY